MGAATKIESLEKIVLYDGVCNFCNSSVKFILKHERSNELKFAALQSDIGREILEEHGEKSTDFDSIILMDEGRLFKKSRAAFRIAKHLKYPYAAFNVIGVLPAFFTDFFYDLVAKNRYKIFGRSDACMLPSPEMRMRFID